MTIALPIESRLVLLVADEPCMQIKNRETGEMALDFETKAPLMSVYLTLTGTGGDPVSVKVSIPKPGVPEDLAIGTLVRAVGLMFRTGEKNGRTWQMVSAKALTVIDLSGTAV